MVDPSRLNWTFAIAAVLCLGSSCGSQVPDGEVPCEMASSVSCPVHVPVCEQRIADEAAFCYREAQAGLGMARRRVLAPKALPVPASRSYRLIEQSVAKMDGNTLSAGR
jgi:hypothetical protein